MSVRSAINAGRRLIAASFVDTATIADRTVRPDGYGGSEETWVSRSAPVPCRFSKLTDAEQQPVALQPYAPAWGTVVFPVGTDIREGDRVVQPAGRVWQVFGEQTPPGNAAVAVRVMVKEV